MNKNLIKAALAVPLFLLSQKALAQTYIDLGKFEHATPVMHYDSARSAFSGLATKAPRFFNVFQQEAQLYRVEFDESLQSWDSIQMKVPENGDAFYTIFREIDHEPGWVLAARHDIGKPGAAFTIPTSYKGNCDLCQISRDSIYNCSDLMPDSAYAPFIFGTYKEANNDTLYLLLRWSDGARDTTVETYLVKYNMADFSKEIKLLDLNKGGFNFDPRNDPIRLANGDWLVRAIRWNASWSGERVIRIDNDWNLVVAETMALSALESSSYSRFWKMDDKVVFFGSRFNSWAPGWDPNDPLNEELVLMVYDPQLDSITDRYFYDFSADNSSPDHHVSNYAALFDGEYFVLAGVRYPDWLAGFMNAVVICAVDTNFQLAGSIVIEDSLGDYFEGIIQGITAHPSKKEYYFMGSVLNQNLTGSGNESDLMIGKLSAANIGLEEVVKIRKQETWLYPNPSNGNFTLENQAERFKHYRIKIMDASGKEVFAQEVKNTNAKVNTELPTGQYFLLTDTQEVLPFVVE